MKASEVLSDAGGYSQACFFAQQTGEKALRAIWLPTDEGPRTHSILRLVAQFPNKEMIPDLEDWKEPAAVLDKHYIPARYPNGLPDLTPDQVYRERDAQLGLEAAR